MAWCISAFGREEMAQIAVEEWASSSPVYTRRMQRALGYAPPVEGGGDVVTIFKGLQLDIGAPPQFMDFRYTVHDPRHGEFHLDHCGALMDVEPMGPDYVRSMCHDIEDPTFDATAVASNPKAQVRPIHRPPRSASSIAADRRPHCAWTVIIDESHPEVAPIPALAVVAASRRSRSRARPDRPCRRRAGRLRRSAGLRPRLLGVLALGPGADRRRGLPPDAPAQPGLPARGPGARAVGGAGARDQREAAGRHRRRRGRADPPRPRHRRARDAPAPPAAQPGGVRRRVGHRLVRHGLRLGRPRRRRLDHALRTVVPPAAPGRSARGRPAPRRARSPAPRPTGPPPSYAATSRPPTSTRSRSPGSAPARRSPSSRDSRCRSHRSDGRPSGCLQR